MTWYGENRSGRMKPWEIGDLVRYDYGPSALMRITKVSPNPLVPDDVRNISTSVSYYGRAFHSSGTCTFAYHGRCLEPTTDDRAVWALCHDAVDNWIRGAWGASEREAVQGVSA